MLVFLSLSSSITPSDCSTTDKALPALRFLFTTGFPLSCREVVLLRTVGTSLFLLLVCVVDFLLLRRVFELVETLSRSDLMSSRLDCLLALSPDVFLTGVERGYEDFLEIGEL
jgi:hypothetical protein